MKSDTLSNLDVILNDTYYGHGHGPVQVACTHRVYRGTSINLQTFSCNARLLKVRNCAFRRYVSNVEPRAVAKVNGIMAHHGRR